MTAKVSRSLSQDWHGSRRSTIDKNTSRRYFNNPVIARPLFGPPSVESKLFTRETQPPDPELEELRATLLDTRNFDGIALAKLLRLRDHLQSQLKDSMTDRQYVTARESALLKDALDAELDHQRSVLTEATERPSVSQSMQVKRPPEYSFLFVSLTPVFIPF
jgi:hypothetical protein